MALNTALKLSELTCQIQQAIDGVFEGITYWIIADVSSYTYKAETNYHYFDLVEKDKFSSRITTKIAGRAWGNASINISNFEKASGQKFRNDINVLVQVAVQYNTVYGLQLNLIDINFTLGQFEQERKATLVKLVKNNPLFIKKDGDFFITRNNNLHFKDVIQNIAIISSETSAGYQDFIHTLTHNLFHYKFKVDEYFTKVQGESNARSLLDKLVEIFNSKRVYDVVVIIRGGGAQSDFLLFDNYELSRAVAKFPIPIITGIGHQKNETIVDLMAHTATKTPTKAAELIIAHNRKYEERLIVIQKMILIKSQQLFAIHTKVLTNLKSFFLKDVLTLLNEHQRNISFFSGLFINRPKMLIYQECKNIENFCVHIKTINRTFFAHKNIHLEHYGSIVKLMNPQNILNKGFAILKVNGHIINNADYIQPGDSLTIQMAASEIKTIVESKEYYNGK